MNDILKGLKRITVIITLSFVFSATFSDYHDYRDFREEGDFVER